MVELKKQALTQTEDAMHLLSLRLENVEARFKKLEAEVSLKSLFMRCTYLFFMLMNSKDS